MTTTKNGRQLYRYTARFTRINVFGSVVTLPPREIQAVNDFQARKKAEGIAQSSGWKLQSIGRI